MLHGRTVWAKLDGRQPVELLEDGRSQFRRIVICRDDSCPQSAWDGHNATAKLAFMPTYWAATDEARLPGGSKQDALPLESDYRRTV